jgi:hypothetical protein
MSQSSNVPQNILFYSEKCQTCKHFITLCYQNKVLKFFQLVNVDDKIKQLSSQGLKFVPTIIIKGLAKPIEGKNVFNWLESTVSLNNKRQMIDEQLNRQVIGQNVNLIPTLPTNNVIKRSMPPPIIVKQEDIKQTTNTSSSSIKIVNGVEIINKPKEPSVKKAPFGYLHEELSGFSDSFAYLKIDKPQPKSFLPYDKDLQIYTAPEGDKLDKKQQDLLIKNIEMIRTSDKESWIKHIDNEHLKIMNNIN